ncbi:hypothetical protein ACP3WJ_24025, partial [Salmonella enterica]|uniref:hypothetical protein n=1 Tax=Salmonella enterica TaxID=28901 RepID=UPI003CEDE085
NAATFYVPGEGYGFTNIQLIIMYQKLRPIKYPYTPPSFPAIVKCGRDKDGKAYIVKIEQEARR